jgi:hypothetical protein
MLSSSVNLFFRTYFLCLPCKESNKEKSPLLKFTKENYDVLSRPILETRPAEEAGLRQPRIVAQIPNESTSIFFVKFKRRVNIKFRLLFSYMNISVRIVKLKF